MSRLMQALLEGRGIYLAPAGDEGEAGGAGGVTGNTENGQETGNDGGNAGGEAGDGDDGSDGDDESDGESNSGIDDEKAKLIKDTMKWKDQARRFKEQLDEITKELNGIDPATARKLAEEAKERERTEMEKKGEYERIVAQMREENEKLIQEKDELLKAVQSERDSLAQQVEDLTIGVKFRESEFIQKESAIPASFAQKEFKDFFEMEDGVLVPYTAPRGAKDRAPMVDANGNPKSFDEALSVLFKQHPEAKRLVKTPIKPGAGSNNNPNAKETKNANSGVRGLGKIEAGLKDLKIE